MRRKIVTGPLIRHRQPLWRKTPWRLFLSSSSLPLSTTLPNSTPRCSATARSTGSPSAMPTPPESSTASGGGSSPPSPFMQTGSTYSATWRSEDIIVSLCRELGSGLAWSLLLGSGVLGNLANACLQLPDHRSVGASTVVFGAVGILAALNLLRNGVTCKDDGRCRSLPPWPSLPCWVRRGNRQIWERTCSVLSSA